VARLLPVLLEVEDVDLLPAVAGRVRGVESDWAVRGVLGVVWDSRSPSVDLASALACLRLTNFMVTRLR